MKIFSFDVESVGLQGEGFGVGYVVIDTDTNKQLESGTLWCDPAHARGNDSDREWVDDNISFDMPVTHSSPKTMRDTFWRIWQRWKKEGFTMVADCPYPVEHNFLQACIKDYPERQKDAPYPLIDVASMRLAVGLNPVGYEERLPNELPAHNPRADAEQSARLFIEARDRHANTEQALIDVVDLPEEAYNDGFNSRDANLRQDWASTAAAKKLRNALRISPWNR